MLEKKTNLFLGERRSNEDYTNKYSLSFHVGEDSKFTELVHFEQSQRGSTVLYYDGYRFTRDGQFANSTNWRCCYFRDKCRARAITKEINGEVRVRITNPTHTCTPKRKRKVKVDTTKTECSSVLKPSSTSF